MPRLTRRWAEWGILLAAVMVLVGAFGREFRLVQGQGELAAIKTTLGALRTALAIDHVYLAATGKNARVQPQRNPFLVLDHVPANYAGVLGAVITADAVPPGNWVFDTYCNCIGYEPLYPHALDDASDAPMLWFRVSAPPGPLQIAPLQNYRWQGQTIN